MINLIKLGNIVSWIFQTERALTEIRTVAACISAKNYIPLY